jgi:ATP-dependent DNA ligase
LTSALPLGSAVFEKDAHRWLALAGGGSDRVIVKRVDLPYQAGNRDGMQKIKRYRSADCVIGGFR